MTVKTIDASGMAESDWEIFALEQLAELDGKPTSGHDNAPGSESGRAGRTCLF